ncbi:hypothetical protein SDC9_197172 [bioreactor metagenome]|uniref:Uncharacterized protein n=1 Tax=bioreactor metagenome TaxID=1076179 RepID=A0A645IDZ6_9ZZZZ
MRATIQGSKEAAAESAGTADADGSARETDAPYSLSVAPTMGAMASGSITSNVINVQPTDRERVEAYLTTNAIPFDETDNEIFAYAYGETFDKFKAFLVNELGMDVPENTDNQYQTTIVFETVAIP